MAAPMAEPMISPMAIHRKVRISLNTSVPSTATSMPNEPRRLPFRAWVGEESPWRAMMKQTDATR